MYHLSISQTLCHQTGYVPNPSPLFTTNLSPAVCLALWITEYHSVSIISVCDYPSSLVTTFPSIVSSTDFTSTFTVIFFTWAVFENHNWGLPPAQELLFPHSILLPPPLLGLHLIIPLLISFFFRLINFSRHRCKCL